MEGNWINSVYLVTDYTSSLKYKTLSPPTVKTLIHLIYHIVQAGSPDPKCTSIYKQNEL